MVSSEQITSIFNYYNCFHTNIPFLNGILSLLSIIYSLMAESLLGKKIKTFNIIKLIGQGAFAAVFQAIDDSTNKLVAVKVMSLTELGRSKKLKQLVQTEISVLRACNNQNVIAFVDSFEAGQYLFIVTQFCNEGDLEQYLKKKNPTEDEAVFFLKQILNGFKGLHQVGAMHRDFKTANVLLNDGVCKIADLGFSKLMEENSIAKTVLGTSVTMAPQILDELPYGFNADIWSIGVVFYQMIFRRYPYYAKNDFALLKDIKTTRPSYDGVNISQRAKDFIQKCLTVDPKKRISWKSIYQHPLIIQKERVSITVGALKSKLKIEQNVNFYETSFQADQSHEVIIKSLKNLEIQEQLEVVPLNTVKPLINMQQLHKKLAIAKNREDVIQKFDNLYICRRNDLMFFSKFVEPYINSVKHLRINHDVATFLIAKKSYMELSKFLEATKNKSQVFYGQTGFDVYQKQPNYNQIIKQLSEDLESMQKHCKEYQRTLRTRLTTVQMKNQMDYKSTRSNNYDGLVTETLREYIMLLSKGINETTGQQKNELLRIIEALSYYTNNPKVHANQFDRKISTVNFNEVQKTIRKRFSIL